MLRNPFDCRGRYSVRHPVDPNIASDPIEPLVEGWKWGYGISVQCAPNQEPLKLSTRDHLTFQLDMFRAFRFVDFYEIKNIHIACCPIDPDLKATRAARLQEAFPPDGKGPTTVREWSRMNWLQPVKLDVYETTRKCLETLCDFLASRVSGRNLQVTFDYIACQQKNMQRLLRCFRPLAPLKQFCLGNGGCFYIPLNPPWMESGELKEIRDLMKQEILQLVAGTDCGPPKSSSRYLPFEILSMIIYHSVVDRNPISLNNHNRLDTYRQSSRLYFNRCCGQCRGYGIPITQNQNCRCINFESYSTSCQCTTIRNGIFLVSKAIRQEALKLYWAKNTFIYQGRINSFSRRQTSQIEEQPINTFFGGLIERSIVPPIYEPNFYQNGRSRVYSDQRSACQSRNMSLGRLINISPIPSIDTASGHPSERLFRHSSNTRSRQPTHTLLHQPSNELVSHPFSRPHNEPLDTLLSQSRDTLYTQPYITEVKRGEERFPGRQFKDL